MSEQATRADARFKVGDRVQISAHGRECFIRTQSRTKTGTVCGFCRRHPMLMRVLMDDIKTPTRFHHTFFDLIPCPSESQP